MKSNLCYISISPKKVGASWLAWFFLSKSHALMHFSLALPKKAEVMVLLGCCGSRTFPWLQAARCSRWSLGFWTWWSLRLGLFLLHSAGPAKLYGLGMFRINTTAQYEKNSKPLLRTRSSHFRSPYGYVICNTQAQAAGIFNRWEMGNMRDLMLWWQM